MKKWASGSLDRKELNYEEYYYGILRVLRKSQDRNDNCLYHVVRNDRNSELRVLGQTRTGNRNGLAAMDGNHELCSGWRSNWKRHNGGAPELNRIRMGSIQSLCVFYFSIPIMPKGRKGGNLYES